MTDTLFKAELELVSTGLQPGVHPQAVPLWIDGINVHFDKYGVHSAKGFERPSVDTLLFDSKAGLFDDATGLFDSGGGFQQITSPATTPIRGLAAVYTQAKTQRVVFGTRGQLWISEGAQPVSTFGPVTTGLDDDGAGIAATRWSMVGWGDWILATNGVEPMQILKTTSFAPLTGSPPASAEILARLGQHVLAFYTNGVPNQYQWCMENDPEQWDPAAGNKTAGTLLIRDLDTEIRAVVPLGQGLAIYGANTIHTLTRAGAAIFGHHFGLRGVGSLGKANIISLGNVNYGLDHQGIFLTDGNSFRVVSYPKFGEWLRDNVNFAQGSKIVGWHVPDLQQLRWSVPIDGSNEPNITIAYNYATNEYTFLSGAITSALEHGVLRSVLVGTAGGAILFTDSGTSLEDGSSITRRIQTKPLHCKYPRHWKHLAYVLIGSVVKSGGPIMLSIGAQERLADPILWYGPFSVDELNEDLFERIGGVYLSLRLETIGSNDAWTFSEIELVGRLGGRSF